ncbi:hypothetical protein [Succinimonas sp.]|uniref:hypothetical protein n=1 Tax=Succinimonas sp. TaxID=1936151 RepID=UPI00386DD8A9
MGKFTVDFYQKEDGSKPVGRFIWNLSLRMKAKVIGDLHLMEEYSNLAREPLSKHMEDGILNFAARLEQIYRSDYLLFRREQNYYCNKWLC